MSLKRYPKFLLNDLTQLQKSKKTVPYIGLPGYENLGDDVLYLAHKELFPKINFFAFRKESRYIYELLKYLGKLPNERMALLGGGTLINRGEVWLNKVKYLQRNEFTMFCLGTGVGQANFWKKHGDDSELIKHWVKELRQFEYVGVRGPLSQVQLAKAGFNDSEIVGDTAISLTISHLDDKRKKKGVIGINYGLNSSHPIDGEEKEYTRKIIKLINLFLDKGYRVKLLPVWNLDYRSNIQLMGSINRSGCSIEYCADDYDKFKQEVSNCDVVIGQKLHSAVLSYVNLTPAIVLEYQPKCRDFMLSIGMEELSYSISDFSPEELFDVGEEVIANYGEIMGRAHAKLMYYKHIQEAKALELGKSFK